MNDRERAQCLTRTIDALIKGSESQAPPPEPEEPELRSLALIARSRLAYSRAVLRASESHASSVWQVVRRRIEARSPSAEAGHAPQRPREDPELSVLVGLRRQMSLDMMAAGDAHRDEVWQRVRARIRGKSKKRGIAALIEGLGFNAGVRRHSPGRRLAASIVLLAAAAFALGPLPATGLAEHPVMEMARFAGERLGVLTTSAPPPTPGAAEAEPGRETSVSAASADMDLPLMSPSRLPVGFTPESARYFDTPITARDGGVFVMTYASSQPGATLTVYQEAAGGADLAVTAGIAQDVTLAGGVAATRIEGSWKMGKDGLAWTADGSRSLLFEADGVRTVLVGWGIKPQDLLDVASGMLEAQAR